MRKVVLALMMASGVSLFAADVSQMTILGIKLGDKYDNIKKKLPCQNKKNTVIGKSTVGFSIECKSNTEYLRLDFDYQGKIICVVRDINLETEPDWNIVYQDLIQKYGEPEMTGVKTFENYNKKTFCYGDCKMYTEGSNTEALHDNIGKSLDVFFRIKNGKSALQFFLIDSQASNKNSQYIRSQEEEAQNKKKQQASKIQF